MTREEWIKIYNAKDGTWEKDKLIDKAYEIINQPIKTNYDRIKSMSVDEMAFWIAGLISVTGRGIDGKIIQTDTIKYYEQWLLQEVSENE